ncbi:hypothetical protein Msil_0726 [Methylocella silvestris BL2]|uniref:Uncharacterized protein n=1 Tax=Methylocella silvestris (strain DSM 15510 / CIP 108128 / LMG 27833 / NCIMB 13906 / BL2) TaxID=395965 RepID=B8EPA9_METSB|nr:hypothetical protein [Methylocella silvestris]ACK49697.1 hypothetical protein Msil_0726 [Methylocella silvestris BL2]
MIRHLAVFAAPLLLLLTGAAARELDPVEREALAEVDAMQNRTWAQCIDAQGAKHLMVRVVPRRAPDNSFAPALTPSGAPVIGYYDFLLYKKDNGQYNIGLDEGPQQLTVADQQNGIEARYVVKLYVPAYRVYDPRTGGWSAWNSGSSWEKEKINFASYTVTKRGGVWTTDVSYNIMTDGQFERPKCGEAPQ